LSWQFRDYAFDKGIELRAPWVSALAWRMAPLATAVADHPFGYVATGKERDREVEPIKVEQEAVPRIVDLRRSGGSASCAST